MKIISPFISLAALMCCFSAFSQESSKGSQTLKVENYALVGQDFPSQNILSSARMEQNYTRLRAGDTIEVVFKGQVATVCQKKGCWMTMNLPNGREVMVKFENYAFFVPKDISGKEVILQGKAYVTEVSVDEQKHYAEDAGKSAAEVAAITRTALTLSFLADGVKIKK